MATLVAMVSVCSPVSDSLSLCLSILVTRLSLSRLCTGSVGLGNCQKRQVVQVFGTGSDTVS